METNTLNTFELSAIFDSILNPVFIKDENLQFVFINKAYEKMFKTNRKHVLGKRVLDLEYLPEEDRIFYQNEDQEMLAYGKTSHHIFDYLYQGKTMHTCLYWSTGFIQKNGTRGLIGMIVDINKQSQKTQTLRKQLHAANAEKKETIRKTKIDSLTGLYNRGAFNEALQKSESSTKTVFSCIMLDIDHFKKVNDTFGHVAGDSVLTAVASVLIKYSRRYDMAFRYGGEEFVILLPGSKLESATVVAERIRIHILENVRVPDGKHITISAGCSEHISGESGTSVVQRADKALYIAKESGRNRVCTV